MRRALVLHPDSRCQAITEIEVELARPKSHRLHLCYAVTGQIGALRLPPTAASVRADALWQHTCFEAFVRIPSGATYYEFNFAPSTEWAAYRFSGYRREMRIIDEFKAPHFANDSQDASFVLQVLLDLRCLNLPAAEPWQFGLSAIIEEADGRKSHWALVHPSGKPDFHHPDCFALDLSAASHP